MLSIHENIYNKLTHFYENKKVPHLLFHGSSGSGKRTIVYNFLDQIYQADKYKLKMNVMTVNCAHGKGIKFIREDLKFFAKTNIQSNSGVTFKTIVLFNADCLTIDAQSALRRCIELFSHNTRFFIVVENKHKLLNPILSRFCEIYVPEYIEAGKIVNLHQYNLDQNFDFKEYKAGKQQWISEQMKTGGQINNEAQDLANLSVAFYENGLSCLDLITFIENHEMFSKKKAQILMEFHRVKSEFRCEKLLMFYMLDYAYQKS